MDYTNVVHFCVLYFWNMYRTGARILNPCQPGNPKLWKLSCSWGNSGQISTKTLSQTTAKVRHFADNFVLCVFKLNIDWANILIHCWCFLSRKKGFFDEIPNGEESGWVGGGCIWWPTTVLPEQATGVGVASVHSTLCIDKIHTPEIHLCVTGSVRLVSWLEPS